MRDLSLLSVVCLAALLLAAIPRAGAAPESIWGRAIMKQPFDSEPFRQIRVPDWVEDLEVVCYGLPAVDTDAFRDYLKNGVQTGCVFFAGPTFACYDSKYLKVTNPDVPLDRVGKDVASYHKAGIRIIAVVPPTLIGEAYFAHPEWRRIKENTTVIPEVDPVKQPWGDSLCLLGGWGDRLLDILDEIVTKYPQISAWSFDGLHNHGSCYCQSCRDAYRKDTGQEIPATNMDDPAFRRYQYWLDRRTEDFIVRMQTRLKALNPEMALITWTTNAGRFGHFLSIPRNMPTRMNLLFDCPDQEFWMDETNRGNTVVPAFANAYMWAVTNHRVASSTPYTMSHGNPYDGSSLPVHEYLRRCYLVMSYGPRITTDRLAEVRSRTPWITHKQPERWAALVMSDNTNTFYGRDPAKDEERYLSNVFGAFRVGIEEHLPVTVINDWNLNTADLAGYKLLVLPNTAVLDEQQAAAIRQFVRSGGGLVASVDTSLFDEYGTPREDFLLADLFGVHYKGGAAGSGSVEALDPNFEKAIGPEYWEKRRSIFDFRPDEHPALGGLRVGDYTQGFPYCFKGQAVAVAADQDTSRAGTITAREAGAQPLPAIVTRTYGKGRVVYLPAGFDSAYYLYPYPYYRKILAGAMRWAASELPRIRVDAPMCVHSTFYRQTKDGQRLVVQLFNDLNSTGNHAKPDDDVPLREETVPVHGIKVTFKGYDIRRIHLEPGGTTLKATHSADGIQVTLPPLEMHSILVAELK